MDIWKDWCYIEIDASIEYVLEDKQMNIVPVELVTEILKKIHSIDVEKIHSDGKHYSRYVSIYNTGYDHEEPDYEPLTKDICIRHMLCSFDSQDSYREYLDYLNNIFINRKLEIQNNINENRKIFYEEDVIFNKEYVYLINTVEDFQTMRYVALPEQYFKILQDTVDILNDRLETSLLPVHLKHSVKAYIEDAEEIIQYVPRMQDKAFEFKDIL